jgi:hypothetical protein
LWLELQWQGVKGAVIIMPGSAAVMNSNKNLYYSTGIMISYYIPGPSAANAFLIISW